MCLISFWYQAFKRGESNDKAIQPAAGLGQRSLRICIGCVRFLHISLSAAQKWWLLLPLFCHWGKLNAEKWLGSSYTPDWWQVQRRACLSGLCYLHQALLIFKACSIVLNACSGLTREELNFTGEKSDPCVYTLVKYIAVMLCKFCNAIIIITVQKERLAIFWKGRELIYTRPTNMRET